jgi:hypothetical protein
MRGIVAEFVKGDLKARGSLNPQDLYRFLRIKFPHALAYENALGDFLDRIEQTNSKQKRREYERKAEKLGSIVYGKQWEYLKQIRLLEKEAKVGQPQTATPEKIKKADLRDGLEQAQRFSIEHRLSGRVLDGYRDGGRGTGFDERGRVIHPTSEVIVVDRRRDAQLRDMIAQAKEIKTRYGTGLRSIFEISKLVYERMSDPRAEDIVRKQFGANPGKEILLGDIAVENGLAGVCRHRALLFQVLAAEIGIDTTLVRGNLAFGNIAGGHCWNEVELYGKYYVVDIANPPGKKDFKDFNYATFVKQGGFPEIGINRFDYRYMDIRGAELYRL